MIIHSYFTEGYYDWAKLFVKSLKKSNGDGLDVVLSSRNLDEKRQDEMRSLYPNLLLLNKDLQYDKMAKRIGINKKTLLQYKNQVETIKVNKENKAWKLMIAAEDRLREILDVLGLLNSPMLHVDIDTYVKKDITPILETIKANDFTTRWRIEKQIKREGYVRYENRATLISVQGYGTPKGLTFLERWLEHLCKVPAIERPTGFGQTSCYRAYLDYKDVMSFGDVPPSFLSPQGNAGGILWGANQGAKKDTLRKYQNDFKKN